MHSGNNASQAAKEHDAGLETQRVNERRQGRPLLPPARVIQKVPGKRRTPVFEDADQRAVREERCRVILQGERHAGAVGGRADQDIHVIDDNRPIDANGQRLAALVELPSIDT